MTPEVSIIIPSYNRVRTLPRAIASVLAQTLSDLELIVVDDGSTDGTREYLAALSDPRLRVIELEKNRGAAGARNVGIEAATGRFIAFQDSDDEWLVTFLEKLVERLKKEDPGVGVCYCGKAVYGRDEARNFGLRRIAYVPDLSRSVVEGDIYLAVLGSALVSTQTFVVRSDILKDTGGFDESLKIGIDWELSTRLAQITRYAFVDEPLVMTFISDDSLTHGTRNAVLTMETILRKNAGTFDKHPRLRTEKFVDIARIYQVIGQPRQGVRWLWKAWRADPGYLGIYKRLLQALYSGFIPRKAI